MISPITDVGEGEPIAVGHDVMAAADYEGTIRAGTTVQRSAILDMSGPGAAVTRFSNYIHLVLSFRIVAGLGDWMRTMHSAGRVESSSAFSPSTEGSRQLVSRLTI